MPVTRIEKKFATNGAIQNIMEHISKLLEDVDEVVFDQPEERAGATEPDGSVLDRRKKDEWLKDTEPYHGGRPSVTVSIFMLVV